MILHYFKKKENIELILAKELYNNILIKSKLILKEKPFFKDKNYNTSFELISLMLIIIINSNIKNKINNFRTINEELIKIFVSDLDDSLRNNGIGDMSIGKYVKSYVKKFYFRLKKFPKEKISLNEDIFNEYFSNFDFIKNNEKNNASEFFYEFFKKFNINH